MIDLIRDKGKIRNCTSNHAKMSIWQLGNTFYSHKKTIKEFTFCIVESFKEAIPFFVNIIQLPLLILFLPMLPYIRAFIVRHNARRDVKLMGEK